MRINRNVRPCRDFCRNSLDIAIRSDIRQYRADHGGTERRNTGRLSSCAFAHLRIDTAQIDGLQTLHPRGPFVADGFAGQIELYRLRIGAGQKRHGVSAGRIHPAADADNRINIFPQRNEVAQLKSGGLVGYHFIMGLTQRPAGNQRQPVAFVHRPCQSLNSQS
ncbi:hypothetical protein SDC9_184358 [bioreactor metagenome]|uniref:Uncharacterized protein n=1 Tax=bioreactor metagenome TaxID=1076179 RepID=A0A645HE92_9ZZZZ